MEYAVVSSKDYYEDQKIANTILQASAIDNHKDIRDLRAFNTINTLNRRFHPKIIAYYSNSSNDYLVEDSQSNAVYLDSFNSQFDYHGIYLHAQELVKVDDIFGQTVSGLTSFNYDAPTLFINASNSNFERIIFTCLHEFAHMYQAEQSEQYIEAVALINAEKIQGKAYPEELQAIENDANVIASLLLVPDVALKNDIFKLNFNQLKDKYATSTTALYNRLLNYFYFSVGLDEYESTQAATAYQQNDIEIINHVIQKIRNI